MDLNALSSLTLDPDRGEVRDAELAVTDDVLLKVFALGPGARIDPHKHETATNVFHVIDGTVVVTRDDVEREIEAPGVVINERGQVHGARNPTAHQAMLTAALCPLP